MCNSDYTIAGASTTAIHGGLTPDPLTGALVTPLVQSTTFVNEAVGQTKGYAYSRVSNPTVSALEAQLGALEDAPPAVCFVTGLAAETALFLALLKAGDHVVLGDAIYGGTVRLVRQVLSELGIQATFVDSSHAENVRTALRPNTKLIFIESPANPTLKLTDLKAVADIGREAGIHVAVDNTFLTPVIQRPLDIGATVCVYSTTKHIEGHSTAVGGSVVSRDPALLDRVRFIRKCTGGIQAAFQAWLTTRGVKTLPLRLKQHSANALALAKALRANPFVAAVNYPGLEDHPQHALAKRQHLGGLHGGILSFEVVGGTDAAVKVLNSAKLCALVEHLGSVETLLTHPVTMTHADVPVEQRLAVGITDGLIRVSVGIEDIADIVADLEQAIALAHEGWEAPEARAAAKTEEVAA
ncbi:MAG: aminotransferase class I/II-fold pyridoxal phosphate-dependent enzyme [Phycisphaerales bacterium]|nr:aminotransferase class I/II-fold pyridoxal phosphate-dependent enzyme [Phycisphaerales bacterium]